MLTQDDVTWIRSNRAEITQKRTELVSVEYVDGTAADDIPAVFKSPPNANGGGVRNIGDMVARIDDYTISFADDIAAMSIFRVIRNGLRYVLVDVDERGLGGQNRWECRAMLMTFSTDVTVTKGAEENGWGTPVRETPPIEYKAFVSESTQTVINQAGEEAVTQLRIVFDGVVDVNYRDLITYTNEIGIEVSRKPLTVGVIRRFDGLAVATEVFV